MKKANRKVQNRELERQKKNRIRLTIGVAALVVVLVAGIFGWVAWDTHSRSWILQFEGARIPTNEMRLFLTDDSTEAKEMALDSLLRPLTLLHRAEEHNVGLTEDEREMWTMLAEWNFGHEAFVSFERMGELLAAEGGEVFERLRDIYVPETFITMDEEALAADISDYLETNLINYHHVTVYYTLIDDADDAFDAHERVWSGEASFNDIVMEFNPWFFDEEGELLSMTLNDFINEAQLNFEQAAMLRDLEAGDVSEIIFWGEEFGQPSHLIIYIASREDAAPDEVARNFRASRMMTERNERMMQLIPQWVEQANFTRNDRAFNLA